MRRNTIADITIDKVCMESFHKPKNAKYSIDKKHKSANRQPAIQCANMVTLTNIHTHGSGGKPSPRKPRNRKYSDHFNGNEIKNEIERVTSLTVKMPKKLALSLLIHSTKSVTHSRIGNVAVSGSNTKPCQNSEMIYATNKVANSCKAFFCNGVMFV